MFIGVSLPRMHILESGIGILCGWLVWLIIFVAVIEYFQYKYAKDLVEIGNMSLSGKIYAINILFFLIFN